MGEGLMKTLTKNPLGKFGASKSRPCRKPGCGRFTSSEYCSRHTPKAVKAEPEVEQPINDGQDILLAIEDACDTYRGMERIEFEDVMPDRWPI